MCGIAGCCGLENVIAEKFVEKASAKMHHRGPDASGIFSCKNNLVWLGHRRLSIFDLSNAANQPMVSHCTRFTTVFNGEIYNYKEIKSTLPVPPSGWKTNGDTEILLSAFARDGIKCLEYLQGMFAFAIYDSEKKLIWLARDRAGEKPLFYHVAGNRLSFASELVALLENSDIGRILDPSAVMEYLTYGYVSGEQTIIKNIHKLSPGSWARFAIETGDMKNGSYWKPPPFENSNKSHQELVTDLERLLENSVKKQLHADVPVGVLLSGGVDSTLVTAIAAKVSSKKVSTFSVVFPEHREIDEGRYSRAVASYCQTDHHEVPASNVTVDSLDQYINYCDEPFADQSFFAAMLLSELVRKNVTVALGGDGADELFGGYPKYQNILRSRFIRRYVPTHLNKFAEILCSKLPIGLRGRNTIEACFSKETSVNAKFNRLFDKAWCARIVDNAFSKTSTSFSHDKIECDRTLYGESDIRNAGRIDFERYLPNDILTKIDRASMRYSLEVRSPWLDRPLIDFAFSQVPDDLKITMKDKKILPKILLQELIPLNLDSHKKRGFFVPIDEWIRGPWKQRVEEVLCNSHSNALHTPTVQTLLRRQESGWNLGSRIFALVVLCMWCDLHDISWY